MEANPGTVERGDLRDYAKAGVNRLSLGAQSFNAESLRKLGRIHGPDEIYSAYDGAERAGFDSINLDVMFALPGQNTEMAINDVRAATALGPAHISYYQLTLEPNTVFHHKPPPDIPDDEESFVIQQRCHELLAENDYQRYEISAFARPGRRCRHNLNYWQFGDYLAAGAGAHGKLTDSGGELRRYIKPSHPMCFKSGSVDSREHEVSKSEIAFEFMLNALRLQEGFAVRDYTNRTGLSFDMVKERLEAAGTLGMVESVDGAGWRPTAFGLRFQNDLTAMFLP
jgi:oxygen-independent coproporphyrinogen-3 oxidase